MPIIKWVNIATKAYQQAVKYEHITKKQREQLFCFIHDWFRMIEDENRAIEEGEETPNEMCERFIEKFKEKEKKI